MTFDWTVGVGTLMAIGVQIVLMIGAYYGLKADNAALASNLALAIITEKTDRQSAHASLKFELINMVTSIDTAVKELSHRVGTLECGQDEWTKALRKRTHDLANDINALVLKLALLERSK